jgi:hypothetical protein
VEAAFSMIKAKFQDCVRSKSEVAMKNEALCKILAHNICCLIMSQVELGIEPVFWQDSEEEKATPIIEPEMTPGPALQFEARNPKSEELEEDEFLFEALRKKGMVPAGGW